MRPDRLLLTACGVEDDGAAMRVYVDGPTPAPSFTRDRGVRTGLFHLLDPESAAAVRTWLARNRAWDVLRVPPPYCPARGVRALRVAGDWHSGPRTALGVLFAARRLHGEHHREAAYREVGTLIESVVENPVSGREYANLRLLAEVVLAAPVGVELVGMDNQRPEEE